MVPLNIYRQ